MDGVTGTCAAAEPEDFGILFDGEIDGGIDIDG